MADQIGYRDLAHPVRAAAREALQLLREERMAKRCELATGGGGTGVTQLADRHDSPCVASDGFDMMPPDVPMPPPDLARHAAAPSEPVDAMGGETDMEAEAKGTSDISSEKVSGDEVSMGAGEPLAASIGALADHVAQEVAPTAENETDLSRLPGAGSGLVWMLQECNIHSLADMAAAEADTLSGQLGAVGHILNVQTWIDFANADTMG